MFRDLQYIGSGNFNAVFCDAQKTMVFKIQKKKSLGVLSVAAVLDTPERSVRLWNQINAHIEPKATVMGVSTPAYTDITKNEQHPAREHAIGWSAPFIHGKDSTQTEIMNAQIDIYNRCGRVVLDAISPGNFKTQSNGQVICIDIGMSLRLQREDEQGIENRSFASNLAWETGAHAVYLPWLKKHSFSKSPYTDVIETTKALYVLQQQYPYCVNADFLRDPQLKHLRTALAKELDEPGSLQQNQTAMSALSQIQILNHNALSQPESENTGADQPLVEQTPDTPQSTYIPSFFYSESNTTSMASSSSSANLQEIDEKSEPWHKSLLLKKLMAFRESLPVGYMGTFTQPIKVQICKNKQLIEKIISNTSEVLSTLLDSNDLEEAKQILIKVITQLEKEIFKPIKPRQENFFDQRLQLCLLECGKAISTMPEQSATKETSIAPSGMSA